MSTTKAPHLFTSESVSEGHPDKLCDQVSDAILDACLEQDPESRVACECLATTNFLVISGEITTNAVIDCTAIARQVIREIGYTDPATEFNADTVEIKVLIHKQSAHIAQGVDTRPEEGKEQGAGDQGMMFGYATNETPELMPAPIFYAHQIVERFAQLRKSQPEAGCYLRPDAKSQVSFLYQDGQPQRVHSVVVSHQHAPGMPKAWLEAQVRRVVAEVIPARFLDDKIEYYVNQTGCFEIGGPHGDTGLTGRKIIVDTYGGAGRHGGGAFSGKDSSKVDRSAAYMCRYVAKNIVAAGLAETCEIQVAYVIGHHLPLSLNVNTFGTGRISDAKLADIVLNGGIFDFRPAEIAKTLGLKTPKANGWSYRDTAAYGHFGRPQFPWERADSVDILRTRI